MTTAKLTRKTNLSSQDSYGEVESLVEQLLVTTSLKEHAFKTFMDKMNTAEKSIQEDGYYFEDEAEKELTQI